ncbi:MAG: hypothetical protein EOM24_29505 [Chloroflexia bacterium]|nr:hypothetical protein [Chloroflexia bacterium]
MLRTGIWRMNVKIERSTGILPVSSVITPGNIPQTEYDALMALYNSTNGPAWVYPHSADKAWASNKPPCDWYGIFCRGRHAATIVVEGGVIAVRWRSSHVPLGAWIASV